ncbi:MAG TPA: META domain-containing protein [Gemmatimonadaceae bacterium]
MALTALVACTTGRTTASAPLEGTHWRLIELNGKPALAAAEQRADLQFARGDSARVSGSSGCNRFMGSFTRNGADLRFGQMASTQMACIDERVSEQEHAFLAALGATERYAVAGDTLTLLGSSGTLARFVSASAKP